MSGSHPRFARPALPSTGALSTLLALGLCGLAGTPSPALAAAPDWQAQCGKRISLRSWKGDGLHRPDGAPSVTTWGGGTGNEWTLVCDPGGKVRLRSWKGDYLHRPDSPQGVTTWSSGGGNEWVVVPIDDKIQLRSWKGDFLHRPDSPQGVTTWPTGGGNHWTLVPLEAPPPASWRCLAGISTPVRAWEGEVQCAARDGRSCLWGRCPATPTDSIAVPEATNNLSCGADHKAKYGSTGYDNPQHWCAKAAPILGVGVAQSPLRSPSIALQTSIPDSTRIDPVTGQPLVAMGLMPLDIWGRRFVGFDHATGGQLLFQNDDLLIVSHQRMVHWWGTSVPRAISVYSGGERVTVSTDETQVNIQRGGFPDNRLGIQPGFYKRGAGGALERVSRLDPIGPIAFTPACVQAPFITGSQPECRLTLPRGQEVRILGGSQGRFLQVWTSVRGDAGAKGWMAGPGAPAHILRADGR